MGTKTGLLSLNPCAEPSSSTLDVKRSSSQRNGVSPSLSVLFMNNTVRMVAWNLMVPTSSSAQTMDQELDEVAYNLGFYVKESCEILIQYLKAKKKKKKKKNPAFVPPLKKKKKKKKK